jgi:hypothetical protein
MLQVSRKQSIRSSSCSVKRKPYSCGFTTVRDLGNVNISIRNAALIKDCKATLFFTAGKTIVTTGGHTDNKR